MKSRQAGFGIVEQLVVTVMGMLFILIFIHGTLVVMDRFFSVQTVTSFDEDRKILRAQVGSWAGTVFSDEVYLSNEILAEYNLVRPDGDPILPYAGSFGSGLTLAEHVVTGDQFVRPAENAALYDISFVLIRDPAGDSLTVMDDESTDPAFPGNPGLYKFNRPDPYVYVDRKPNGLKAGDMVALSSVAGAGFAKIKTIEDRKLTLDFENLGEFRPDDSSSKQSPFVVFYKGGTITTFQIGFVAVDMTEAGSPRMLVGRMNRKGADKPFSRTHSLQLPVRSLRLVRGAVTTIPGGTFIPFDTPQQLAATIVVPSFLSSRMGSAEQNGFFDSEVTFLVPL